MKSQLIRILLVLAFLVPAPASFAKKKDKDEDVYLTQDDVTFSQSKFDSKKYPLFVNLPGRKLYLFDEDGRLLKVYQIAVGSRDHNSPMGERTITSIIWNPWWHPPQHSEWAKGEPVMPPGPKNPMGPVKIDIGKLYYIHGTNEEFTVGRPVTHGCIRLRNDDAKELAYWLQTHYSSRYNDEAFHNALDAGKESITIGLDRPVPLYIFYDLVEIRNDKLFVYSDIYLKTDERDALIEKTLKAHGYSEDNIKRKQLDKILAKAKNNDVIVKLDRILKDPELKAQDMKVADIDDKN